VSDDTIKDIKEIITDYSPFHAILHNIKINTKIVDIILPPKEEIKSRIKTSVAGEKTECGESIYCKVKYKDGKTFEGKLV
jgi:hypothetical protein